VKDNNWEKDLVFHPEYQNDLWEESYYLIDKILKNYDSDSDIVTLGCSVTVGCGVEPEQVWATQIAKNLNLTNNIIAMAGGSVQWAISNFFSYIEYFKKPKIVLALFPDFLRMQVASRPKFMIPINYDDQPESFRPESHDISDKNKVIRYKFFPNKRYQLDEKYLKLPINAKDHFPRETAFDISIQYIKMLEAYCNSNNILLIWSTWFPEQEQWLSLNLHKTKFKNYIPVDMRYWHAKRIDDRKEFMCENLINFYNDKNYYDKLLKKENLILFSEYQETFCDPEIKCNSKNLCHLEFSENKNFYSASDSTEKYRGHISYHAHIHVAEKFLKEMEKNENYPWNK